MERPAAPAWLQLAHIPLADLGVDRDAAHGGCLLSQKPLSRVRLVKLCATPATSLSFRAGPVSEQLWEAAVDALKTRIAPYPHPNLVQLLGVARDSPTAAPAHVVTEYIPMSLYDALHHDHMKLTRREIMLITTNILLVLQFLHSNGESFGASLTSRKVMLDGNNKVKLRRFGLEFVLRAAKEHGALRHLPETSSFWKTQYEVASLKGNAINESAALIQDKRAQGQDSSAAESAQLLAARNQDLFAFGMLLLEMCASEKPSSEIYNRISCAEQMDPIFGRIIRLALSCGGLVVDTGEPRRNEPLIDTGAEASASSFLRLLAENEEQQQRASEEELRLSSASFPSFLHADRYFIATEAQQVERSLQTRESQFKVATKRLGAVEQELIEEQNNFEVLVRQFEKVQHEKQHSMEQVTALKTKVQELTTECDEVRHHTTRLTKAAQLQSERTERLQMHVEELRYCMLRLQDEKLADMMEKQSFLMEILKLKDEKRKVQEEKSGLAKQINVLAAKVGNEQDAMEDLEGRWKQVIFKWEQEQKARRKVERQHELLNTQLVQMEDERSMYSFALNHCPTGPLDPKQATSYVLELKEKEIQVVREAMEEFKQRENELQLQIAQQQRVLQEMSDAQQQLQANNGELETHQRALSDQLQSKNDEVVRLTEQLRTTKAQVSALTEKIADFEEELERQAIRSADEGECGSVVNLILGIAYATCELTWLTIQTEKARRLRQCLTPQCDAPKFLIEASGYCKECEEKARKQLLPSSQEMRRKSLRITTSHRRQRSLDSASESFTLCSNNAKNAQVVQIVRAIREMQELDSNESQHQSEREARESQDASSQILGFVKRLTSLLKENEALKDDLPECLVLKTLLSVMKQFSKSLALQLECCKCLSAAVFSHDRNRIILVAEGAVELVLSARKYFPLDVKLLEASCVLLTNLSHNCESNRKRILESGGVDSVLLTMQALPQHPSIQKKSCWALLTLAGSDSMCNEIAARGGLGAIIAGMLNCPADEHVQHYGAWALLNLVSGTSRLQSFARREGVAEVAEAAIACFPDHPGIQEKARQVLQFVSSYE